MMKQKVKISVMALVAMLAVKLGNITYRSHAVYVLCQSEDYKVLHSIGLHEDYKGGKYGNAVPRNDTWNQPIKLVK